MNNLSNFILLVKLINNYDQTRDLHNLEAFVDTLLKENWSICKCFIQNHFIWSRADNIIYFNEKKADKKKNLRYM